MQKQGVVLEKTQVVTLQHLVRVARGNEKLDFSSEIIESIQQGHELIKSYMRNNLSPVYGLTTGLGSHKDTRMSNDKLSSFYKSMILDHSSAVGPEVTEEIVRGTIFARLSALSKGGTGISVETFQALLNLLNAHITPIVNGWGSVGEADLAQLGQIASVLMGNGTVYYQKEKISGDQALEKAGLIPINFQPRDTLALLGANSYSTAIAGLAIWDAKNYINWSIIASAFSWIAFGANPTQLRVDVLKVRGDEVADVGRKLLDWISEIKYSPRSIQDPLSFRCMPQVLGSFIKVLKRTENSVLYEMSNPLDNPLLMQDSQELVANGNFDPTDLTLDCDTLRNAMFRVMLLQKQRVGKLLTSHFSGFPTGLTTESGHAGLNLLRHSLLSIVGKASQLSQVTSPQLGETAEGVEDYGSMVNQAAQSLEEMVNIWRLTTSIELIIAVQALTLTDIKMKGFLNQVYEEVNKLINKCVTPSEKVQAVEKYIIQKDI